MISTGVPFKKIMLQGIAVNCEWDKTFSLGWERFDHPKMNFLCIVILELMHSGCSETEILGGTFSFFWPPFLSGSIEVVYFVELPLEF